MRKRSNLLFAQVLLTAFVGIILLKPAHFLFVDHSHFQKISHDKQQSNTEDNCSICQFTFDFSTEAVAFSTQHIFLQLLSEFQPLETSDFTYFAKKFISLRAPPFFLFK